MPSPSSGNTTANGNVNAAAPFLVDPIGVHRQEGGHLGLDRVAQPLPGAFTPHGEQRSFSTIPPGRGSTMTVSSSMAYPSSGDFSSSPSNTPPPTSSPKFDHSPAPNGRFRIKSASLMAQMAAKLQRAGRRSRDCLRQQTVEPVLGQIKQARGFRRFLLRGITKV